MPYTLERNGIAAQSVNRYHKGDFIMTPGQVQIAWALDMNSAYYDGTALRYFIDVPVYNLPNSIILFVYALRNQDSGGTATLSGGAFTGIASNNQSNRKIAITYRVPTAFSERESFLFTVDGGNQGACWGLFQLVGVNTTTPGFSTATDNQNDTITLACSGTPGGLFFATCISYYTPYALTPTLTYGPYNTTDPFSRTSPVWKIADGGTVTQEFAERGTASAHSGVAAVIQPA